MRVAWVSYFPVDWLTWPGVPQEIRHLPRQHPASWQRVLLEELRDEPGLELHVFSVRKHYARTFQFTIGGVTFHCIRVPRGMRTLSLFWWETILIRNVLRKVKPDLVHAWGTERGAALVATRLGYPTLISMQGLLGWIRECVNLGNTAALEARLENRSLKRASFVTAESKFAAGWLGEHYPHLQVSQIEHAPDWRFHRLERRPETQELRFLFIGAMSELKGTDLLVQALDKLTNELTFKMVFVGGGRQEFVASLRNRCSPRLWDRITIRTGLTPDQVAEEIGRATIMLFPTRADNSPNSVKEAVVAGLPVVASNVGGIPDYVRENRNGILVPAGSVQGLIDGIHRAVEHPLFGKGRVDQETLGQMREYLSPARMSKSFLDLYRRILSQPR